MRTSVPLAVLILLLSAANAPPMPVRGRVVDAKCAGLANLVVKLLPPRESGAATVVTATNDDGTFHASVDNPGSYYVSVYQGPQQLYGKVESLQGDNPLTIVLKGPGEDDASCGDKVRMELQFTGPKLTDHEISVARKLGRQWADKNRKPGTRRDMGDFSGEIVHIRPSVSMQITFLTDQALVALAEMRARKMGRELTEEELRRVPATGALNVLVCIDESTSEKALPTYRNGNARAELWFKSKHLTAVDLAKESPRLESQWDFISKVFSDLGQPVSEAREETTSSKGVRAVLKFTFAAFDADSERRDNPEFVLTSSDGRQDKVRFYRSLVK